jgi:hypothetical protein
VEKISYASHNNKDNVVIRLYVEKQLHLDSLILRRPIYYVISALDMTKLKRLAKTIGYSTFFIYELHHPIHDYPLRLTNQT